jgi:iron complex outermembrane receptor protein
MAKEHLSIATLTCAGCMLLAPVRPAYANDPQYGDLEEVIVTARRSEENLQRVPIAVTAFTPEQMAENRLQSAEDLMLLDSSLNTSSQALRDGTTYTLRGVGQTSGGSPSVVTYFAEVPVITNIVQGAGGASAASGMYFDLANVEVLHGPQGTLFGRNTTGGAVLFVPHKPTNELEGYAQVSGGSCNDREFQGALNVPVVDNRVLLRAAVDWQKRDGFTHDLGSGKELDNRDYFSGRLSLTLRPSNSFENDLVGAFYTSNTNGTGLVPTALNPAAPIPLTSFFPTLANDVARQQALGVRTINGLPIEPVDKRRYDAVIDTATWTAASHLIVKNIASYQESKDRIRQDLTGLPDPILALITPGGWSENLEQASEELQLQGRTPGDALTWTLGGFYSDTRTRAPNVSDTKLLAFGPNPFAPFGNPFSTLTTTSTASQRSYAIFGETRLDAAQIFPALQGVTFDGGYRYTWDTTKGSISQIAGPGLPPFLPPMCAFASPTCQDAGSISGGAPTWLLGIDYQIRPQTMVYLSVRRGYKSGGINLAVAGQPFNVAYKPEFVTSTELGLKADWQVGRWQARTNIAAFHDAYSSKQELVNVVVAPPGGIANAAYLVENAAHATINGVEFNGVLAPGNGVELSIGYTYLHTRFDQYQSVTGDLTGYPLRFAPTNKVIASARYHLPLAGQGGDVSVAGTLSSTSAIFMAPEPYGTVPGYTVLNFDLAWKRIAGRPLDLDVVLTNATNKVYKISDSGSYDQLGLAYALYGEPRMITARIRYRF